MHTHGHARARSYTRTDTDAASHDTVRDPATPSAREGHVAIAVYVHASDPGGMHNHARLFWLMRSAAWSSSFCPLAPLCWSHPRLTCAAAKVLTVACSNPAAASPPCHTDGPAPKVLSQPDRQAVREPVPQKRDNPHSSRTGFVQRRESPAEGDHAAFSGKIRCAAEPIVPSAEPWSALWDRLTRRCVLLSAALLALSFSPVAAGPAPPVVAAGAHSTPAWMVRAAASRTLCACSAQRQAGVRCRRHGECDLPSLSEDRLHRDAPQ